MDTQSAAHRSRDTALKGFAWFISTLVVAILIIHSIVLFFGQISANKMVIETGDAIQAAVSGSSGSPADFTAAIQYIEAAQNAYSADTSAKFLSLVYTILTTAVLGWGSKMLLIGAEERKELMDKIQADAGFKLKEESRKSMKETLETIRAMQDTFRSEKDTWFEHMREIAEKESKIGRLEMEKEFRTEINSTLQKTQSEFSRETEDRLRRIENKFKAETENKLFLQSAIFVATTSCRNAAHTCLLLQTYIEFMDQMDDVESLEIPEFADDLEVDFIHSLERFLKFLMDCAQDKERFAMTREQKKLIEESWDMATYSIKGYINEGGNPTDSPLYRMFGEDYQEIEKLYRAISAEIKKLSDSDV